MTRSRALSVCLLLLLAGCERKSQRLSAKAPGRKPALPVGKPTHLNDDGRDWRTSSDPIIATSEGGRIYVLSTQVFDEALVAPGALPVIPSRMLKGPADTAMDGTMVPGLSVYDGNRWQPAQMLSGESRRCEPVFAWCMGEELHLIATMYYSHWHHLRYSPGKNAWDEVSASVSGDAFKHDFEVRTGDKGTSVDVAVAYEWEISWLRYDGAGWSEPVGWRTECQYPEPALAVAGDGKVHVVWTSPGKGVGHAVIADGRATTSRIDLGDRPFSEQGLSVFDIDVGPDGQPRLVYAADLPEGHKDRNLIHVASWDGEGWSKPTPTFTDRGLLLGQFQIARRAGRAIMLWEHRMDYTMGNAFLSHPVSSHATRGPEGKWSTPAPTLRIPARGRWDTDSYLSAGGLAVHLDRWGLVHMAWYGEGARGYHVILADLAE